jgi:hypothetical protein
MEWIGGLMMITTTLNLNAVIEQMMVVNVGVRVEMEIMHISKIIAPLKTAPCIIALIVRVKKMKMKNIVENVRRNKNG